MGSIKSYKDKDNVKAEVWCTTKWKKKPEEQKTKQYKDDVVDVKETTIAAIFVLSHKCSWINLRTLICMEFY